MAHELDSQGEWQRLYDRYHAMGDEELLEFAEGIGSLTERAANVLRREIGDRRLRIAPVVAGPSGTSMWWNPGENAGGGAMKHGEIMLMVFHDAIDAGQACEFLEEREVDFEMRDVAEKQTGMRGFDSPPPVALGLVVAKADRERAMAVLREKMGLFPLQEVEEADELVDDGTLSTLGDFARREEAEEIARVLDEARIWHRISTNPEGTVQNEDCYTLEVREVDLMRAGAVVEKAMDFLEG
jgi:hypothetical protein